MSTTTVNVAFQQNLLREIDAVADREARSRSELIREATRVYVDDRKNWQELLNYGHARGQELQITDAEIMAEIKAVRRGK
ncbi:MAG: CopG family ribbon-helix-helix protein [Thermoguttaceae bacterium]